MCVLVHVCGHIGRDQQANFSAIFIFIDCTDFIDFLPDLRSSVRADNRPALSPTFSLTLPRAIVISHLDIARSGTLSRHENGSCLFSFHH